MMYGRRKAALVCTLGAVLVAGAAPRPAPVPAAKARAGQFVDLTPEFIAFAEESAGQPDQLRVKAFHDRFDPLLPGYYNGKDDQAAFDRNIANKLAAFKDERAKFIETAGAFRAAFARGEQHFRRTFPDYRLRLPVYLVHSMGIQDGGTRTLNGRTILFFGADVIARIHDESTIGPFLDHELFHAYHRRAFPGCEELWCSLWEEGMATYVAARLNPGATDRQLLLTIPRPIAPEVEPQLAEAMCEVAAKFHSTSQDDYGALFLGRAKPGKFPPRYGYYIGYLLAKSIGKTMSLGAMANLPPAKVEPLLAAALASGYKCPPAMRPAAT